MIPREDVSPLTINRLSVYLRCLQRLRAEGVGRISSQRLAGRFDLSAAQIRKDLAHFGELGIRGVGYDVEKLLRRLEELLGLDRIHRAVIIGAGNIGRALARFPGFGHGAFRIVAVFDDAPQKIGEAIDGLTVRHRRELAEVVRRHGVEIGILAVPADAAQEIYQQMVDAGIRSILNFAPARLEPHPGVRLKTVDLLIFLEELAYFLG